MLSRLLVVQRVSEHPGSVNWYVFQWHRSNPDLSSVIFMEETRSMQSVLLVVDEVESNKRALHDLKLMQWQMQKEWLRHMVLANSPRRKRIEIFFSNYCSYFDIFNRDHRRNWNFLSSQATIFTSRLHDQPLLALLFCLMSFHLFYLKRNS